MSVETESIRAQLEQAKCEIQQLRREHKEIRLNLPFVFAQFERSANPYYIQQMSSMAPTDVNDPFEQTVDQLKDKLSIDDLDSEQIMEQIEFLGDRIRIQQRKYVENKAKFDDLRRVQGLHGENCKPLCELYDKVEAEMAEIAKLFAEVGAYPAASPIAAVVQAPEQQVADAPDADPNPQDGAQ